MLLISVLSMDSVMIVMSCELIIVGCIVDIVLNSMSVGIVGIGRLIVVVSMLVNMRSGLYWVMRLWSMMVG